MRFFFFMNRFFAVNLMVMKAIQIRSSYQKKYLKNASDKLIVIFFFYVKET